MPKVKKTGTVFDPGLCRCCGLLKKCRVLNEEYEWLGQKESYSVMMLECFGVMLSHLDTKIMDRLICARCVQRLRDALSFRKQVLNCEEAFQNMKEERTGIAQPPQFEVEIIKTELTEADTAAWDAEVHEYMPSLDDILNCDDDYNSLDEMPLTDPTSEHQKEDSHQFQHASQITDKNKPNDIMICDDNYKTSTNEVPHTQLTSKPEKEDSHKIQHTSQSTDKKKPNDVLKSDVNYNPSDEVPRTRVKSKSKKEDHSHKLRRKSKRTGKKKSNDDNSSDDVPLTQLSKKTEKPVNYQFWRKPHRSGKKKSPKVPISQMQQQIRERDDVYLIDTNINAIVEYSHAYPFRCRHNNLHCYYCPETFVEPSLLREHTARHSPSHFKIIDYNNMIKIDLLRIDCRLCDEKISDLEQFKHHIVSVHQKKYYFDARDKVLPFKLKGNDMRCAICDVQFPYFHALNKHMNVHFSNYVCETCGLGFVDRNRFVMHQVRHEQGVYPCGTCGKLFKAEYNRELHIDRVHRKKGRVYCGKCDARLMSHPQKVKHLATVHGIAPVIQPCNICGKVFDTRRMLTIHWRKDHLKDFRYQCQICGQKFFTRFGLTNHMPSHTRERNFKCKECGKTYPRLKTLKEHMRIHNDDRRFGCDKCGQAFIQKCSLKNHMKTQHSGIDELDFTEINAHPPPPPQPHHHPHYRGREGGPETVDWSGKS